MDVLRRAWTRSYVVVAVAPPTSGQFDVPPQPAYSIQAYLGPSRVYKRTGSSAARASGAGTGGVQSGLKRRY